MDRNALWPLLKVSAALAGALLLLNLAFVAAGSTSALDWLPERQTGTGFLVDNRQRVAAAEREYARGQVPKDTRLAAVVGISNTREGFDLAALQQGAGSGWRFLGVAGAGAGTPSIVEQGDILLESRLKPDVVVLGVMPLQFMDTLVVPSRAEAMVAQVPVSFTARAKAWIKSVLWLVERRQDISLMVERQLLDARHSLFEAASVDVTTQDTRSPWRPMMRTMGAERYPQSAIDDGLAWAASLHAFDRATYADSAVGPTALADLIARFRSRGARVIVVYTPEHPALHARIPSGMTALLDDKTDLRGRPGPPCFLLDMRGGYDQTMFVDLVHLNSKGSRAFSERFAEKFDRIVEQSAATDSASACERL